MPRQKPNRGVVLLVVLSLLVLFVVVGVTFIVVARQARTTAETGAKRKQLEEQPHKIADMAIYQILRGASLGTGRAATVPSSLQGQSLLGDLYGSDGVAAQLNLNAVQAALSVGFPIYAGPDGAWGLPGVDDDNNGTPDDFTEMGAPNSDDLIRWEAAGEFILMAFSSPTRVIDSVNLVTGPVLSPIDDYYNGCVLTMVSGDRSGHSTRVVDYWMDAGFDGQPGLAMQDDNNNGTPDDIGELGMGDDLCWFRIERFPSDTIASGLPRPAVLGTAYPGDRFVVNGRPFNGTGAGFSGVNLDAGVRMPFMPPWFLPTRTYEQALLPHFGRYHTSATRTHPPEIGGLDESYDAVDYQNMFLSMVPGNPRLGVIPSFHRPSLMNFWWHRNDGTAMAPQRPWHPTENPLGWKDLRRGVLFRPMPWDHPNFTGGNQSLALAPNDWNVGNDGQPGIASVDDDNNGQVDDITELGWPFSDDFLTPVADARLFAALGGRLTINGRNTGLADASYDIDNDGDGIRDSIWMDIGLPVKTAPDGRLYKPLVAVLIKDMDGRLNVNAHGNIAQSGNHPVNRDQPLYFIRWTPGPDGAYGVAGRDDDKDGNSDDYSEGGWPGSDDGYILLPTQGIVPMPVAPPQNVQYAGTGAAPALLPRGQGYGPAEVSLLPAFPGAYREAESVVRNRYLTQVIGPPVQPATVPGSTHARDDKWSIVKNPGTHLNYFLPNPIRSYNVGGNTVKLVELFLEGPDGAWGRAGVDDDGNGTVDDRSERGWPRSDDIPLVTLFNSPPDSHGVGTIGYDRRGAPVYQAHGLVGDPVDDPYEHPAMTNALTTVGAPLYSIADLEALLRHDDQDTSSNKSRLLQAAPVALSGNRQAHRLRRSMLTTHASHIPAPAYGVPQDRRGLVGAGSVHLLDLYRQKITAGFQAAFSRRPTPLELTRELKKIVPIEIRLGRKLDINRWFGNGWDDNRNHVVDEPLEEMSGQEAWTSMRVPPNFGPVFNPATNRFEPLVFTHQNNDPLPDLSRQQFARHLYCLMMLLVDGGYIHPVVNASESLTVAQRRELTSRRIAQWAVNVVDFRDSDSIMTGFEYDANPWNGWQVDGVIRVHPGPDGRWGVAGQDDDMNGTIDDVSEAGQGDDSKDLAHPDRRVVWGCERAEVMITETLALHDRRVKDTDLAGMNDTKITGDSMDDDTMDQYRIPQGSLFIELYCPATRYELDPRMPHELFDSQGLLDLDRMAPGVRGVLPPAQWASPLDPPRPVWQLVVAREKTPGQTPKARIIAGQLQGTSFDPRGLNAVSTSAANRQEMEVDRLIWFVRRTGSRGIDVSQFPNFYGDNVFQNYLDLDVRMRPGSYFVVGPRRRTRLGSNTMPDQDQPTPGGMIGPQRLEILEVRPNGAPRYGVFSYVDLFRRDRTIPLINNSVQEPRAMVAARAPRSDWESSITMRVPDYAQREGIGISISEPLPSRQYYYDPPHYRLNTASDRNLVVETPTYKRPAANGNQVALPFYPDDAYYDLLDTEGQMAMPRVPTDPFDSTVPNGQSDTWEVRPLRHGPGNSPMLQTGSYANVRSVFLQRLADPTIAWNPLPGHPAHSPLFPVNPYVSVDWASIDLTVFNGEDNHNNMDQDSNMRVTQLDLGSRQRGRRNGADAGDNARYMGTPGFDARSIFNPMAEADVDKSTEDASAPPEVYFKFNMTRPDGMDVADNHTLGYLNHSSGPTLQSRRLNALNVGALGRAYIGDPALPFQPLWWLNRPFANPIELMYVPSSSPDRLLYEMSVDPRPLQFRNAYDATTHRQNFYAPFAHLLNFWNTTPFQLARNPANPNPPNVASHFYRIFDYVETPSRYVGTERWYSPTSFRVTPLPGRDGRWGRAGVDDDGNGVIDDILEAGWRGSDDLFGAMNEFRPPYNRAPTMRDPGRININTIFNGGVWEGIVKGFPDFDPAVDAGRFLLKLNFSRRGYHTFNPATHKIGSYVLPGGVTANPLALDDRFPTLFANPFRASWASDLMPLVIRQRLAALGQPLDGIQATLLRRDSLTPMPGADGAWGATGSDDDMDNTNDNESEAGWVNSDDVYRQDPLFVPNEFRNPLVTAEYRSQLRSPFHRYLGMQKVANVVAHHSNVFAVWVTVGYFEVEPVPSKIVDNNGNVILNGAHPDGYRLGRELGVDSGTTRRHRAFYIIDRSIPVAFEPGQNHNVDRAILLRRYLQ